MNEIKIFSSPVFGSVRTAVKDSEPLFCLADLCRILELSQASKVKQRLNEKGVHSIPTLTAGGTQELIYINEANLYKTIFQSRKETAEQFTDWVTGEVLPSIRKHGGYIANQENLSDDELMAKALLVAQRKIEEKNEKIKALETQNEIMKPKAAFADAVGASSSSVLIGVLAKLLKQNGVDIGQNRLFEWLRENGYLCKHGSRWNLPTQKAMDLKLFEVQEYAVRNRDGNTILKYTVKVTGKGQRYFIEKFLSGSK